MKLRLPFVFFALLSATLNAAASSVWIIGREGLSVAQFDPGSGQLAAPIPVAEFPGGSWVAEHPQKPIIYASRGGPKGTQGVVAYQILPDRQLRLLDQIALPAGAPSHLELDATGTLLAGAHWGGEAVSFVPIAADGAFQADAVLTYPIKLKTPGPHPVQTQARPHWAQFSADGRYCFVVDLGSDRIWTLAVNRAPLSASVHAAQVLPPGFGPRHLAFTPDRKFAVVSGELSSQIASLRFEPAEGVFGLIDLKGTLDEADGEPNNNTSEIRVHPNGRFAYIGNRGHDSIAVFVLDPQSGGLAPIEREAVRGVWPRNFDLDPTGQWLIAAGQHSNSLTVFAIDAATGELTFNRQIQSVLGPTRVWFGR